MTTYNSIRPVTTFLLFSILFFTSACTEKASTHSFIHEDPPTVDPLSSENSFITPILNVKNSPVEEESLEVESLKRESLGIQYNTIWERLFSLYALPEIENDRIEKELQKYLKRPKYMAKIQQRAEPYLYFIIDEIESKQIPGELALLPAVESAFRPDAISKSRASGLWQFMPATGLLFGLEQNWWYDGRNDIYKSTKAATSYLKRLSQIYNDDWFLALSAYNAGMGTIRKAIRKNKKNNLATDYWSLALYKETMTYVPKLLAIAKILANAEKYNIPLQKIPNKPYFNIVNIDSPLDLSKAAEMAQMPINNFFTLNPAFKRSCTVPNSSNHLLIHIDKFEIFKEKLAQTPKKDRMKWIRHKIRSGENLGLIAKKHRTTVSLLRQSNNLSNTTIRAGKYLLIPPSFIKPIPENNNLSEMLYIVKKGDTFWDIARQFSVSSRDIANWNNLSLTKILRPGQKLIIKRG
jgi:membrane-bound lytic murein transglycosylase D